MARKKEEDIVDQELSKDSVDQQDIAIIPKASYPKVSIAKVKKAIETVRTKHKIDPNSAMLTTLAKYEDIREFVSTGFEELDYMLGGGLPKGKVIEMYGYEGSGKSSLAYYLASRYDIAAYIDAESKFTKERALFFGIDPNKLIIETPDTAELAMDTIRELAKQGVPLIIVDSIPSLTPEKQENTYEKEDAGTTAGVAMLATLISHHIWAIARYCKLSGSTVLFINQLRDKVGFTFGFGETTYTPGGRALKHAESQKILVAAKAKLKASNEIYGLRIALAMKKNQVSEPFRTAEINLIFDLGLRGLETEKDDLKEARKRALQRRKEELALYGRMFEEDQEEVTVFEEEEAVEA